MSKATVHAFSISDAVSYGAEEAIVLQYLRWLSDECRQEEFALSCRQIQIRYPYWTTKQARRILHSLVGKGAVASRVKDRNTTLLTLLVGCPNGQPEVAQMGQVGCPNGQPEVAQMVNPHIVVTPKGLPGIPKPLPLCLQTPEFISAGTGWIEDRKARRIIVTPRGAELALKKLEAWGPEKAIVAIETSIMNGWRGIFEPTNNNGKQGNGQTNRTPSRNLSAALRESAAQYQDLKFDNRGRVVPVD
jgi:hypothetical protein